MKKVFIVDIGKAWTKSFLLETTEEKVVISSKMSLPTSVGDLGFAYNQLHDKLKVSKDTQVIITGSLPEAETLSNNLKVDYVTEEDAKKSFRAYLDKANFKHAVVLDAGDYKFSPATKINQLGAFLKDEIGEIDIENYFGNKSLRPRALPVMPTSLEIEEAFLRTAFAANRDFINAKNVLNVVLTGSFISLNPNQSKLALIMADVLSAGRVAQVKLDKELFVHSFGALLKKNPEVENLEVDFLSDLGSFISFGGRGKIMLDWGLPEKQEISIEEDEIALIPSHQDQSVKVTFLESKDKDKITLQGGAFGVLLDGRVKPLKLAFGRAESREALKKWADSIQKMEAIA